MHPPPRFLLHFLDLGQSNGARPMCTWRRKPTTNPGAMIPPVHHRRSLDNLIQPSPLLADHLMHPSPRLPATRPKLTANPSAMISPIRHRRSFHNLLGDCCCVDKLLQPFPLIADRLMHPPPQSPAIWASRPTLTANPGAMISPVHHGRSRDNLLQPFPLLADRLMHPPSRLPAIWASRPKLTANRGAMTSSLHRSRSFDDPIRPFPRPGDCCSVDNLLRLFLRREDCLMHGPSRSPLHRSDPRLQAVAPGPPQLRSPEARSLRCCGRGAMRARTHTSKGSRSLRIASND
jgi:hypothetical protein